MATQKDEKATANSEVREAARPGGDGKLEDAVRRSMIDLEQEKKVEPRQQPSLARRLDELPA